VTHFTSWLNNMKWIVVPIVLAFGLASLPVSDDLNSDPALGSWRLNQAKCQFSNTVPPVSVMRSFQAGSRGLTRISETRLIPDGEEIVVEYLVSYDGKEYPMFVTHADVSAPTKLDETVSLRRIGRRVVGGVFRNHGKETAEFTREISNDGQSLSVRIVGTGSTGGKTVTLLVYDRLIT
jgi:hypothetical protein